MRWFTRLGQVGLGDYDGESPTAASEVRRHSAISNPVYHVS
jgi:hypothetical protein